MQTILKLQMIQNIDYMYVCTCMFREKEIRLLKKGGKFLKIMYLDKGYSGVPYIITVFF